MTAYKKAQRFQIKPIFIQVKDLYNTSLYHCFRFYRCGHITSNDILGQLRVTGIEILEAYDPEHGAVSIMYSFANDSELTKPKYQTPQRGWQHSEQV